MDRFTKKAAAALAQAPECAGRLGHSYIGSEHLLLGILYEKESIGARLLLSRGITFEKAEKKVVALVGRGAPKALSGKDMTPRVRRIIEQSFTAARRYGQNQVGTEHLLGALLGEYQSTAAAVLEKMGVDTAALRETVTDKMSLQDPMGEGRAKPPKTLQKYGVCLTARAAQGQLDPLIGREAELERLMVILCRRHKNNPCLVGDPGVGKTVLAEGLAGAIVTGSVPLHLRGKQLWQLELTAVVAGTKYRGEFEERIRAIVEECEKNEDILLFVDEVHTMMGTGAAEGAVDAANILKPALARGKLRLIGATTMEEYRRYIEKDSALERRFAPLYVEEPTPQQTCRILEGLLPRLEEHHGVIVGPKCVRAAVELSTRYLHDRCLPDKAIDLLDEACSQVALRQSHNAQEESRRALSEGRLPDLIGASDCMEVGTEELVQVVSRMTGIPAGNVGADERRRLQELELHLGERMAGQEAAVAALCNAVRAARMMPAEDGRPVGCFLLAGPTGVGKTHLCRVLAETLFDSKEALIKLDMSEFMEKHTVSRLIGAPPGYVGHEIGGKLIDQVRRRPYSVVLFDEIEKAHPDVCALLLQIMEDGVLTDGMGKRADFRHAIVILTTNIGGSAAQEIGFGGQSQRHRAATMEQLRRRFSPELMNRLDQVLFFEALTGEQLGQIAQLLLQETQRRLERGGCSVQFEEDVIPWIVEAPETRRYGARALRRFIHEYIEIPLGLALLAGTLGTEATLDRTALEQLSQKSVATLQNQVS